MVLAKGLRSQSRYCWAGTHKVASRAVSALEGRDLTAFVVSFASAMRQLECKSGVSPLFFKHRFASLEKHLSNATSNRSSATAKCLASTTTSITIPMHRCRPSNFGELQTKVKRGSYGGRSQIDKAHSISKFKPKDCSVFEWSLLARIVSRRIDLATAKTQTLGSMSMLSVLGSRS